MRARIKSSPDFDKHDANQDCEWLLTTIKGIMLRFESQRFVLLSMADATQQIFTFCQGQEMSLAKYYEDFKNLVEVFEHYGGDIGISPSLIATIITGTEVEKRAAARTMYVGILFLRGANRKRLGGCGPTLRINTQGDSTNTPKHSQTRMLYFSTIGILNTPHPRPG
jgi:hypothetical protein